MAVEPLRPLRGRWYHNNDTPGPMRLHRTPNYRQFYGSIGLYLAKSPTTGFGKVTHAFEVNAQRIAYSPRYGGPQDEVSPYVLANIAPKPVIDRHFAHLSADDALDGTKPFWEAFEAVLDEMGVQGILIGENWLVIRDYSCLTEVTEEMQVATAVGKRTKQVPHWWGIASEEDIDAHNMADSFRAEWLLHRGTRTGKPYRIISSDYERVAAAYVQHPSGEWEWIGQLSWFGGKWSPGSSISGAIHQVFVEPPYRRDGVASAMLALARKNHPDDDIEHSTALSDDGKAWSQAYAARQAAASARRCEVCKGAIPDRMARTRDAQGRLVCDGCKGSNMPEWTTTHSSRHTAVTDRHREEMSRRESEALTSIMRVAHDSGDQAVIHHCPFCGSGAVTGGSDGSVECGFCHTVFTVQVQPAHPNMPQTINGQPANIPGMPGGEETELSAPSDPAVEEETDGVAEDPLNDAGPAPEQEETAPGQPPSKQPPWLTNQSSRRTAGVEGHQGHDLIDVSMSWGSRLECDTCRKTVEITGEEGNVVWTEGEPLADLKYVLRGRPSYEFPGPKPEVDLGQDMRYWEKRASRTAVQTSDPNSREEHPYPDMGDYVVIADAIRRFIRAGLFSTYEEARRSGVVDRLRVDGIQSNLTTEQKVQEVLSGRTASLTSLADRKFFTAEGDVLDGERYLKHLAIAHADDRQAVIAKVRGQ